MSLPSRLAEARETKEAAPILSRTNRPMKGGEG
jgi:hypothetical protein